MGMYPTPYSQLANMTYHTNNYQMLIRYVQVQTNETKENEEMSVSSKIRELSKDADSKLLAKHGVTNEVGELTAEGKQVLWDMLFANHKEAIVTKLKEIEAAEKKETK
jgi:hypothetical protein